MSDNINTEMINDLKELMEEEFSVLIETFIADADNRIVSLKAALDEKDSEQVREVAHAFKGSSANLGATKLSEICLDMENLGRNGQLEETGPILANMRAEYELVRKYFKALL